jgi:hypothetical protein
MLWEYRIMSLTTQKEPQEAQEALNNLGGWSLNIRPEMRSITCSRSRSKMQGERKHKGRTPSRRPTPERKKKPHQKDGAKSPRKNSLKRSATTKPHDFTVH